MNVLPVITRELRAESRSPFTYWLRVLGAGAVILAAMLFIMLHGFRADDGGRLFAQLHGALHLAIWVLVPMLTVDCLSRERREGTLGLLFLTPLKALDIVIAKSLAHGLRAVTLLLAVLPVVALPLLMGGVSWKQAVSSLLLNAATLCLALAAGLLASSLSKTWVRALILAIAFALLFACLYCVVLGGLFSTNSLTYRVLYSQEESPFKTGFQLALSLNPDFFATFYYSPARLGMMAPAATANAILHSVFIATAVSLWLSLLALGFVALISALITKRNWQQRPPSPAAVFFTNKLCTPIVMLDLLKRWMKHKLDRNPIGWMEQRTWSGRIVIWGWLAVMISVYSLVLTDANFLTRNLNGVHVFMGWVLFLSMAVNASSSFRRERENGVLELLLVSPLSEAQIIMGRLRGIWGQFLPSMALLMAGWIYLTLALHRIDQQAVFFAQITFFATSFLAVPVIGIYYSLIFRNFLASLLSTVLVAMVLPAIIATPVLLAAQVGFNLSPDSSGDSLLLGLLGLLFDARLVQLAIATWRGITLHSRLVERRFATETT